MREIRGWYQNDKKWSYLIFLHKIMCFVCVLESPLRGNCNAQPRHMILLRFHDNVDKKQQLENKFLVGKDLSVSKVDMRLSILTLELPLSEVNGSQGKPTTQVSYPFMLLIFMLTKFDFNLLLNLSLQISLRSFNSTILCQWIKPVLIFWV